MCIRDRSIACVREGDSCVVGMPVKDTIKVVGADGFAKETPKRSSLWQIQTPQTFPYGRIREAYEKVMAQGDSAVTDDAMMLETAFGEQVQVIEGSYQNLKITTPEDISIAELYLNRKSEKKCWHWWKQMVILFLHWFETRTRRGIEVVITRRSWKPFVRKGAWVRIPSSPLINTDDTDSGNRSADTILYHYLFGEVPKLAEGTPLERVQVVNSGARVQIPPSPLAW